MTKYVSILIGVAVLMACSTDANEKPKSKTIPEKVGEVTPIETVYEEGAFDTPVYSALLKELELCSDRKECLQCATCTPEFFRFFEIAGKDRLEDVFAIQIKALTKLEKEPPLPTREVRVYSREAGSLVRCNRIRGYVIERITSKSGVDDLLIRIRRFVQEEDEEYFFHCLFKWSDKDRKYIYRSVERIETRTGGGDVKEEFKAETSQQVYNELVENGFIL